MEIYEVSEIKRFLRWANYNMTDALQVQCVQHTISMIER